MRALFIVFALLMSSVAISGEAADLRVKGQVVAHRGDSVLAKKYFSKSAKLGDPTAQVELALLLESSGEGTRGFPESYAWYSVVVARKLIDTRFANGRILVLEERMASTEMLRALELAVEYKERYAK